MEDFLGMGEAKDNFWQILINFLFSFQTLPKLAANLGNWLKDAYRKKSMIE